MRKHPEMQPMELGYEDSEGLLIVERGESECSLCENELSFRAFRTILIFLSLSLLLTLGRIHTQTLKSSTQNGTIGLALQGGSLTSATICAGLMRGFQQQTVTINGYDDDTSPAARPSLERFAYISSSSGGNIPATQYAYAPNRTSDELLDAGGVEDPEGVTAEELARGVPAGSVFASYARSTVGSMTTALAEASAAGVERRSVFFQDFIYHLALEAVGIPRGRVVGGGALERRRAGVESLVMGVASMVGPVEMYPEWLFDVASRKILQDVESAFPSGEKWSVEDCVYSRCGSKPLSNADLLAVFARDHYQAPLPCIATPTSLNCPSPQALLHFNSNDGYHDHSRSATTAVSFYPFNATASTLSTQRDPYTLEKFLGIVTNALPMSGLRPLVRGGPFDTLLKPATIDIPAHGGGRTTMAFVDGGYNDRMGVPPLVAKGVRKIIATNFWTQQSDDELFTSVHHGGLSPITSAIDEIRRYFGVFNTQPLHEDVPGQATGIFNHIFDARSNGVDQLRKFADGLQSLHDAGSPLVMTLNDLTTVYNPFWGIPGGDRVDLTIITVRGVPRRFSDRVPVDAAPPPPGRNFTENGFFTNPDLRRVPNIPSGKPLTLEFMNATMEDVPLEFGVGEKEARMTSILCSWIVKDAWDGLRGVDGELVFGGFRQIFES